MLPHSLGAEHQAVRFQLRSWPLEVGGGGSGSLGGSLIVIWGSFVRCTLFIRTPDIFDEGPPYRPYVDLIPFGKMLTLIRSSSGVLGLRPGICFMENTI